DHIAAVAAVTAVGAAAWDVLLTAEAEAPPAAVAAFDINANAIDEHAGYLTANARAAPSRPGLVRIPVDDPVQHGHPQDAQVEPRRPVGDVVEIVLDALA